MQTLVEGALESSLRPVDDLGNLLVPPDEERRMCTLRSCGILGTPEESFPVPDTLRRTLISILIVDCRQANSTASLHWRRRCSTCAGQLYRCFVITFLQVEMCLVSLVDQDRQWFKSHQACLLFPLSQQSAATLHLTPPARGWQAGRHHGPLHFVAWWFTLARLWLYWMQNKMRGL